MTKSGIHRVKRSFKNRHPLYPCKWGWKSLTQVYKAHNRSKKKTVNYPARWGWERYTIINHAVTAFLMVRAASLNIHRHNCLCTFISCVRLVAKSAYYHHVRPSVRPSVCQNVTVRLLLDGFTWNLKLRTSRKFVKIFHRVKISDTLHEDLHMFYCFRRHEISLTALPPSETVPGSWFVRPAIRPSDYIKVSPTGRIYLKPDTDN
jgi:hypothetical protein